jgi:hypothetical protein
MNIHFVFIIVKDEMNKAAANWALPLAEFGLLVQTPEGEKYYIFYKGEPCEVSADQIHSIRLVGKRELGETIREQYESRETYFMYGLMDEDFRNQIKNRNEV